MYEVHEFPEEVFLFFVIHLLKEPALVEDLMPFLEVASKAVLNALEELFDDFFLN